MTAKIYKVLGKKGAVVIPFEMRTALNLNYNDIISFTPRQDGSIIIRKEAICDCICDEEPPFEDNEPMTLEDFFSTLTEEEQRQTLVQLSSIWAQRRKGEKP